MTDTVSLFDPRLPTRFWAKITPEPNTGCWLWTATLQKNQYVRFGIGKGRSFAAHRVSYEALVGPIHQGLEIDHLCRVRFCVNPLHLEPVTHSENMLRAASAADKAGKVWRHKGKKFGPRPFNKTHCKNGHRLTEKNLYVRIDGNGHVHRRCRACHAAAELARYRRKLNEQR